MAEIDQDLAECLSTLRSGAPPFAICPDDPNGPGDIQHADDFISSLATDRSPAIYLHGSPGTGKSVFSSTVFRAQQSLSDTIVAYYSFSATDLRRTTSVSLLCSLIYQILVSDISKFAKVQDHYSSIQELSLWTSPALWALFISLLTCRKPIPLLCIVNEVHNLDPSSEPFLRQLVNYLDSNPLEIPIKLILIGELRQDFGSLLQKFPLIDLDGQAFAHDLARTWADSLITRLVEDRPPILALYLKQRLEERLHNCMDLVRLSVTIELFGQGIRGGIMPTKVCLVDTEPEGQPKVPSTHESVSRMEGSTSRPQGEPPYTSNYLRAEIDLLPYDMSSLVAARFESLPGWAMRALSWILYAQRPMKIRELAVVLALVEHEEGIRLEEDVQSFDLAGDLRRAFGPLLEVHGDDVSLRHEQVAHCFRQIIRQDRNNVLDSRLKHPIITEGKLLNHWSITRILLKYLVSSEFQEGARSALREDQWGWPQEPMFEIADYAILFWPAHYRRATEQDSHAEELLEIMPSGDAFGVWQQIYCQIGGKGLAPKFCGGDPLFFAAQMGFADVAHFCLATRPVEDRAKAISRAGWAGHSDIVKTLLHSDDMQKAPSKQTVHSLLNALVAVSSRGFENIVTFLLEYLEGAKVSFDWNPILLCQASELGYNLLVKLFIEKGAAIDATHDGTTPLQLASKNGHELIVNYLLAHGADVNARHASDRCKPILHAATKGFQAIARKMLHRADLCLRDSNGRTALHLAACNGHEGVVTLLMESLRHSHHEAKDSDGRTALHLAAQNGHVSLTISLVNAWKDGIMNEDNNGHTPLKLASKGSHSEVVRILLDIAVEIDDISDVLREGARWGFRAICELCTKRMDDVDSPDGHMQTALHHAAFGGHHEVVQFLIDCGANTEAVDDSSNSPLRLAAFANKTVATKILLRAQRHNESEDTRRSNEQKNKGLLRDLAACSSIPGSVDDHVNTIRALLEFKVDPNAQDQTSYYRKSALHCAAEVGKVDVLKVLVDYHADPEAKARFRWTPIFYAVMSDKKDAVHFLLEKCHSNLGVDQDGWTPLHVAAQNAKVKVMEVILDADPVLLEHRTKDGRTPLHFAFAEKNSAVRLLERGANINARTDGGLTTLMVAAGDGIDDVVTLLLSRGADLRLVDKSKRTAAHWAAKAGRFGTVQKLLAHDHTIINHQDDRGQTLLHIAVKFSLKDVDLLLKPITGEQQSHIDTNLQDEEGYTPLLLAVIAENGSIVQRLLEDRVDAKIRDKYGDTALLKALKQKKEEMWKLLLNAGAEIDVNDGGDVHATALHSLAWGGALETMKKLVKDHKADVNAQGGLFGTPLQAASAGGFDKVVRYLLDEGADPCLTGGIFGHALGGAAFSGLLQYIDEFMDKGAVIDYQDAQGRSAIHMAAWRGGLEVFRALKKAGATMILTDHQGRSVMHHAAMGGSEDIVKELLADMDTSVLNKEDKDGWLPLHWACRDESSHDVVGLLTEKADDSWAQIVTPQEWTPEKIADFHLASALIPSDKRIRRWRFGDYHMGLFGCDGCHLQVSQFFRKSKSSIVLNISH